MGRDFRQMGWADREVKVKRDDLLKVLRENRDKHLKDYKEACEGYRELALQKIDSIFAELKSKIGALKEGQTIAVVGLHFGLDVPVSHEKAYDQIIRMMEMSVDSEIVLTASQFACFVMDDWEWKSEFEQSTAFYAANKPIGGARR